MARDPITRDEAFALAHNIVAAHPACGLPGFRAERFARESEQAAAVGRGEDPCYIGGPSYSWEPEGACRMTLHVHCDIDFQAKTRGQMRPRVTINTSASEREIASVLLFASTLNTVLTLAAAIQSALDQQTIVVERAKAVAP